jgi:hypothetical protein
MDIQIGVQSEGGDATDPAPAAESVSFPRRSDDPVGAFRHPRPTSGMDPLASCRVRLVGPIAGRPGISSVHSLNSPQVATKTPYG